MSEFFHRTHIVTGPDPATRVILTETRDDARIHTRLGVTVLENNLYRLSIDYVEKPRGKKGARSSSTSFVVSHAGLAHIFGVVADK